MISGIEFLRRKARMTQSEVAAGAGISVALLGKLSVPYPKMTTSLAIYMRLADVFHVAVDDLLELHDEQELELGDRVTYRSRTENLENCVAVYRREKNLSLEQLGQLLGGKTKECARLGCDMLPQWKTVKKALHPWREHYYGEKDQQRGEV